MALKKALGNFIANYGYLIMLIVNLLSLGTVTALDSYFLILFFVCPDTKVSPIRDMLPQTPSLLTVNALIMIMNFFSFLYLFHPIYLFLRSSTIYRHTRSKLKHSVWFSLIFTHLATIGTNIANIEIFNKILAYISPEEYAIPIAEVLMPFFAIIYTLFTYIGCWDMDTLYDEINDDSDTTKSDIYEAPRYV